LEIGSNKPSYLEVGSLKICSLEISPIKPGVLEVSPLEIGILKVGILKIGHIEPGLLEVGSLEVGSLEVSFLKVGKTRRHTTHIHSYQPCLGKLRTEEIKWPLKRLRGKSCSKHKTYDEDQESIAQESPRLTLVAMTATEK